MPAPRFELGTSRVKLLKFAVSSLVQVTINYGLVLYPTELRWHFFFKTPFTNQKGGDFRICKIAVGVFRLLQDAPFTVFD